MNISEKSGIMSHLLQLLGIGGAVVGFVLATAWTLRIGLADMYFQRHTLIDTEKAIRLTPGQAVYQEHLAGYLRDIDKRRHSFRNCIRTTAASVKTSTSKMLTGHYAGTQRVRIAKTNEAANVMEIAECAPMRPCASIAVLFNATGLKSQSLQHAQTG